MPNVSMRIPLAVALLLSFGAVTGAWAQTPPAQPSAGYEMPSGIALFKMYCSACHGQGAKGDGPIADSLKTRPPDLTAFAKRNGGKFDVEMVYRIIDGRQPVQGHGGKDMPVWGDAFAASRQGSTEESIKQRIEAIVRYLESIQVK